MARTTNNQITDKARERLEFQGNSTSAEWRDGVEYLGLGRLPRDWREVLRGAEGPVYVVKSYETPIAWWTEEGGWVIPDVRYSVTTSKAQGYVRYAAGHYRPNHEPITTARGTA